MSKRAETRPGQYQMDFTLMNEQETIDVIEEERVPSSKNIIANSPSKPKEMIFEQEQSQFHASRNSSIKNFVETGAATAESHMSSKYQIPKIDSLHSFHSKG